MMARKQFGILGAALVAWVSYAPALRAQNGPPQVVLGRAERREVVQTITLVGTVGPLRRSLLGAEVAGLVVEMPVREGDAVEAGQVLCALSDETLRFELAEAHARMANLRARFEELQNGTRAEEKRRYEAALGEAQAVLERWEYEKQRVDRLFENTQASTQEHRETYAAFHSAVERKAQAQADYDLAVSGPRKEVIAQAQHLVAAQQAVVDRLAADVKRTGIKAPFAGHVIRLHTEVGQWIDRGGDVLELIELDRVLVRVDVPEFVVAYCHVGDEVAVSVDALKRQFNGRVRHIVSQADRSARTFPVDVEIDNANNELKAGMFTRVTLVSGPKAPAVVVPRDAVVQRDGTDYVTLVVRGAQGPTGVPTPVTLGAEDEDYVAITSGNVPLDADVVVRGNEGIIFPMPIIIPNAGPDEGSRAAETDRPPPSDATGTSGAGS